jgi:hypothetical protein
MSERIGSLHHGAIVLATNHPEKARGYIEAALIRARYPKAKGLSPMMKLGR